jgi:glutaredoxin-like protein NrdH
MVETTRVAGKDRGRVLLFSLSTCVWCRMTKRLLNDLGVAYEYIDVDHLDRQLRREVLHELRGWNPKLSYPTLVVGEQTVIVGLQEDEIRKALNHE